MSHHSKDGQLHAMIHALLTTQCAGKAVAHQLGRNHRAWQDRAVIGDLRARRAEHAIRRAEPEALAARFDRKMADRGLLPDCLRPVH